MKQKTSYEELERRIQILEKNEKKYKRVEQKLKLATNIINASPAVAFLWKNEEGWPVEYVSENVKELLGYSVEEFMQAKVLYANIIHPDDIVKVEKEVNKFSENFKINSFKHKAYRLITKTGKIKWVSDDTVIKRNNKNEITHYQGVILDVTEHIKSKNALKKSKEKAEASEKRNITITKTATDAIITIDSDGIVLAWNDAAEKIFGYFSSEILNKNLSKIMPAKYRERHNNRIKELKEGKEQKLLGKTIEITAINKQEKEFPIELSLSCWKSDNKKYYTAFIRDITDRKNAEIQQKERIKELNGLYSLLKEAGSTVNFKKLLDKFTSEIIPQSMPYPDKVFSEISINRYIYTDCKNISKKTNHYLKSAITFKNKRIGELQVGYIDKNIQFNKNYAQNLINAYGAALGNIIENYNFYEKLIKAKENAEAANEKTKESEEKYKALFENMTDSFALHKIVIDENNKPTDYIFIEINKMFELQTGLKKENIINKKVTEVIFNSKIPLKKLIKIFGTVALTGKEIRFEHFSNHLNKWYSVLAYSSKIGYFATIYSDITEQKIIEKRILNTIIDTEEKERNRFSQELHDGLGPILSTIKMYFQWLATNENRNKKEIIVEKGEANINEAIETLKEISNNISPRTLNRFGLVAATQTFINRLLETSSYIINLKSDLKIRLQPNIEITLYRVVTELINNTIKHANAKKIDININYNKKQKILTTKYSDNGKGFDVDNAFSQTKGFGIMNIQQRIKTLGGEFIINSGKTGTNIKIIINL